MKNPILLWGHNYFDIKSIIGAVTSVEPKEKEVVMKGVFADTETGQAARKLYEDGILKAVSVGFMVKERTENIITKAELLELSFVSVPANPEALALAKTMKFEKQYFPVKKQKKAKKKPANKAIVRFEETVLTPEGREWDASEAKKRLQKWATVKNDEGEEIIDFEKYRRAFTWYDAGEPELLSSYKLPHHDIVNDELAVVWRGVAASMAALLGARGGVDIPDKDRKGVYGHLVKHYEQYDKNAPEFSSAVPEKEKQIKLTKKSIEGLKADINATIDAYICVRKAKTAKKGRRLLTAKEKAVVERAIVSLNELKEFAGRSKDDKKSELQDQIKLDQAADKTIEKLIKGLKQAA
jgi:HK97 family phage prohead protease